MPKQKFTIEHVQYPNSLWVRIGDKRYFIAQSSGEYTASEGMSISDFDWQDPKNNPEIVNQIFQAIADKFSK